MPFPLPSFRKTIASSKASRRSPSRLEKARRAKRRRLRQEILEGRQLLAGDLVAMDDPEMAGTITTDEDSILSVINVAANDTNHESPIDPALFTFEATDPNTGGTITPGSSPGTFTFDPGDDFQDLNDGATREAIFSYFFAETADPSNFSNSAFVTVTVNGANDPSESDGDSGSVTEDSAAPASGDINNTDVDNENDRWTPETIVGDYGSLSIDASGSWTYTLNDAEGDVDALNVGGELTDTITVTSIDGTEHTIVITISGANDPSESDGDSGGVTEDSGSPATGNINNTDVDNENDQWTPETIVGDYGSLTINASGAWTYTLDDGNGDVDALNIGGELTDTIAVTSIDGTEHPIVITINGANDPSISEGDSGSVTEDSAAPASGDINNTDVDDADDQWMTASVGGTYGSLTIDVDGNWSYTLNDANGDVDALNVGHELTDTITVTSFDGTEHPIVITISGANDPSQSDGDSGSVTEDSETPASGDIDNEDVDNEDDQWLAGTYGGQYGSLTIEAGGNWTYLPDNSDPAVDQLDTGDELPDVVTVQSIDGTDHSIGITIIGANDAPVAMNDIAVTDENASELVDVLANDTDVDGDDNAVNFSLDSVSIRLATEVTGDDLGTVDIVDNQLFFDPGEAFDQLNAGVASIVLIDYTMSDDEGFTSNGLVQITVGGSNDVPTVDPVDEGTDEDTEFTGDFVGMDLDTGETETLTFAIVPESGPSEGSVINNDNGTFTFDPGDDFQDLPKDETRAVSFQYTATDAQGAASAAATVTITVTGTNDTPTVAGVSGEAVEDGEAIALSFDGSDLDAGETETLTFTIVPDSGPTEGSVTNNDNGTFTFDPGDDFQDLADGDQREVSFQYTATDVQGAISEPATVTITVTGTNDTPTVEAVSGAAGEDGEPVELSFDANDLDAGETDTLTFAIVTGSGPSEGSVINNDDGTFTFDPGDDFQDLAEGDEREVSFEYTATDTQGAISEPALVTIVVTGTNDTPTVAGVSGEAVEDGEAIDLSFDGSDLDAGETETLTFAIVSDSGPSEGSVTNNDDGTFTFDPGDDFQDLAEGETREVSFQYTATDMQGAESAAATVTITVTGTNDTPMVAGVTGEAEEEGDAVEFSFDGSDQDAGETETLSFTIVPDSGPTEGNVTNNADGTFTFDPGDDFQDLAAGETREISFQYTATDVQGATSEPATVAITVMGINTAPDAADANFSETPTDEDTPVVGIIGSTTFPISLFASDIDSTLTPGSFAFTTINVDGTEIANDGVIVYDDSTGDFTFDPTAVAQLQALAVDESATVTVDFIVDDGELSDTGNATFLVNGVNDAPVAADPNFTETPTDEDTPVVGVIGSPTFPIALFGSDIDSTLTPGSFAFTTIKVDGTEIANDGVIVYDESTGDFTFDPTGVAQLQALAVDESATVTVDFIVTDGELSDTGTATFLVNGVNDAPVAADPNFSETPTDEDTPVVGIIDSQTFPIALFGSDIDNTLTPGSFAFTTIEVDGTEIANDGVIIYDDSTGDFTFDPTGVAQLQALAVDESATVTVDFTVTDGELSDTGTATFLVNGVNDEVTIVSAEGVGTVIETSVQNGDDPLTDGTEIGTIVFDDVDVSDVQAATADDPESFLGSFTVDTTASDSTSSGSVQWTFEISDEEIRQLDFGQEVTQTYTVVIDDQNGSTVTQDVTITLVGTVNDFLVNTIADSVDQNPGDGIASDASGNTSLRAALEEIALADEGSLNTVRFDLPTEPAVIAPNSSLPRFDSQTTLLGLDISSDAAVEISGANLSGNETGLRILANDSIVSDLVIRDFPANGILVRGDGVVVSGTSVLGSGVDGVVIRGGAATIESTVIENSGRFGISSTGIGGNVISDSSVSSSGSNGIVLSSPGNSVIGNQISDNTIAGIVLNRDATGTEVAGNTITGVIGEDGESNQRFGIVVRSSDNTIGAAAIGEETETLGGNLIEGNGRGIFLNGSTVSGNTVFGNEIVGNADYGVSISGGSNNLLSGNRVSGNGGSGIILARSASDNVVESNWVGLDAVGSAAEGNARNGIAIITSSDDNLVTGNVVAGNLGNQVLVSASSSRGNQIVGNVIGFSAVNSETVISGGNNAITISASRTTVANNQIAGSTNGVVITGEGVNFNEILDNELSGMSIGIRIEDGASVNEVIGNTIVDHSGVAVRVADGTIVDPESETETTLSSVRNRISQNAMIGNGGGIELVSDVAPNDVGDADEGPNRLQNAPQILAPFTVTPITDGDGEVIGNRLEVDYFVNTNPSNANYPLTIELFVADSTGQGIQYLATDTFTPADFAAGTKTFTVELAIPEGEDAVDVDFISLTATDDRGNTSEFAFIDPADTNADLKVSATDALLIINALRRGDSGAEGEQAFAASSDRSLDVNRDGRLSPIDALVIINRLRRERFAKSEPVPQAIDEVFSSIADEDKVLADEIFLDSLF